MPSFTDAVAGYVARAEHFEPADARYLTNHEGHLMVVKAEEKPFMTAELIRDTTFAATAAELKQRIANLRDAGYTQFTVQLTPGQEHAIEDWGEIRRSFVCPVTPNHYLGHEAVVNCHHCPPISTAPPISSRRS